MTNLVIGALCFVYGVVTLCLRMTKPSMFPKLERMKHIYGDKTGSILHLTCYSIIPIVAGMVFLYVYFADI